MATEVPSISTKVVSKELRTKANDFLNSRRYADNLLEIITYLEECAKGKLSITSALLTVEVVFKELLKRRELSIDVTPLKPKDEGPETKYREWLVTQYERSLDIILDCIGGAEKPNEAAQALATSMKLLAAEGIYPLDKKAKSCVPKKRLRNILIKLISANKSQVSIIHRFKEYCEYPDIVYNSWKQLSNLVSKAAFENDIFACNFLELLTILPVIKEVQPNQKLLCSLETVRPESDCDYSVIRRCINKLWKSIVLWSDGVKESVHRQVLIVLIEHILPHLDKPISLTDFLMDSLDCGGAVSLLALQGIFTLIQKHNITYPNIYEKLYSMFEPEIFHTKFKARLFYLADIFLSSTHLPESLVAAFVKRLARLSLIAPPQDAIIIVYFIGNLILRHTGLKCLISAQTAQEVSSDPFVMDEREPMKSNAIDSSLWEIVFLQKHALPSVATAAMFLSQPLPRTEWDLSSVLEVKEDDIFDQEIAKKAKQYAIAFERPQKLFLQKNDHVIQYWKLY